MRTALLLVLLSVVLIHHPAAAQEPPVNAAPQPPFNVVASVRDLMRGVVDPAAAFLWNAMRTEATDKGIREVVPQTDEEWMAVWGSALVIAESGNLLMMGRRARDRDGWMKVSRAFIDSGVLAMQAAQAKDTNLLFEASEQVSAACQSCHRQYAERRP